MTEIPYDQLLRWLRHKEFVLRTNRRVTNSSVRLLRFSKNLLFVIDYFRYKSHSHSIRTVVKNSVDKRDDCHHSRNDRKERGDEVIKRLLHVRNHNRQRVELKAERGLREILVADSHPAVTRVLIHIDRLPLVIDLRGEHLQDVLVGGVGGEHGESLPPQHVHPLQNLLRHSARLVRQQLVAERQRIHLLSSAPGLYHVRHVDRRGQHRRLRAVARNVEIPGHPRDCQRALQPTALLPRGEVQKRQLGGDHVARLLQEALQKRENAVHRALAVVVCVFIGAGRSECDQRRQCLDAVHLADVEIRAVRAVHLGDDHVRGEGALDHALGHAFVDGRQCLAPVAPRSEEVHQDHGLRGGDALEVLGAFDERADRFGLHHFLIAEIEIQLHWALGGRK